jgi:hypothetical protein
MKKEVNDFKVTARREIEHRLKRLCGRPSPVKRLIAVLIISGVFAIANIWYLVGSIYSIGKNDAEKELIKVQHIELLNFQGNDSINQLKQKMYEYREQSNDGRE